MTSTILLRPNDHRLLTRKWKLQAEQRRRFAAGSAKLSSLRLTSGTHFQDLLHEPRL